ncbi:hypothetical protein CFC21_051414, partial [Triticum aestivum]
IISGHGDGHRCVCPRAEAPFCVQSVAAEHEAAPARGGLHGAALLVPRDRARHQRLLRGPPARHGAYARSTPAPQRQPPGRREADQAPRQRRRRPGLRHERVKLVSSVSHRHLVRLLGAASSRASRSWSTSSCQRHAGAAPAAERGRPGRALDGAPPRGRRDRQGHRVPALGGAPAHLPRDIKSSNILLDHEYNSKVAELRAVPDGHDLRRLVAHLHGAAGHPGVRGPAVHQNFHLSDKSDVYSFGVVLVEIINGHEGRRLQPGPQRGQPGAARRGEDRQGLRGRHRRPLPGPAPGRVDAHVHPQGGGAGLQVLAFHSEIRPSMAEVADELEQIQVSGWAPSADDAAFMSTTSSLCSSAPSRGTDKSLGPDKGRGEALPTSAPATAVAEAGDGEGRGGVLPVSVQERWFSDRSSPSSNSLLGNSSSLH